MKTSYKKCIIHVCVKRPLASKLSRCVWVANIIRFAKFHRYNVFGALRSLNVHVALLPQRSLAVFMTYSGMRSRAVSDQIIVIAMHIVAMKFIMSLFRKSCSISFSQALSIRDDSCHHTKIEKHIIYSPMSQSLLLTMQAIYIC